MKKFLCSAVLKVHHLRLKRLCKTETPWLTSKFIYFLSTYVSVNSKLYHPPSGQIFKTCQIPAPQGKFFWSNPRGPGFPGTLHFKTFSIFFTIFKTSIINLSIEYLQIRRENIDLSMKICKTCKSLNLICISY